MRQKSETTKVSSEQVVKDIRRATRKQYSAEEKIRVVLDGLRGEHSIAELCRREGICATRRSRYLLSGLIRCGTCGGGMALVGSTSYGCAAARNEGTVPTVGRSSASCSRRWCWMGSRRNLWRRKRSRSSSSSSIA